jgi:ubiquinone/menaquinone biosynthesis C-methylase UbiE
VTELYTAFASVYDRLMQNVDYPAWAAFYRELLQNRGVAAGAVCECACGTGNLTLPLAKTYDMTGVDLSADMLAVAQEKARRSGLSIPFVQMDMRDLQLHRPADGVLCTCDGVNYLESEAALAAFFRAANHALRPGGALVFDVSTPYKLRHILGNNFLCEDAEDIAYLWKNSFHAKTCRVEMSLSIFKRTPGGLHEKISEEQTQYGYTLAQLKELLLQEGFAEISVHGERTPDAPKPAEKRWHIAATKKER